MGVYALHVIQDLPLTPPAATMSVTMSRPLVSSPLADSPSTGRAPMPRPAFPMRKSGQFATSRALRPFPTISTALQPSKSANLASKSKPIKLIEPPKNFKMSFVLDLTQAELRRQE
ncbi:hypothetical protein D9611_003179 [Ephemerocybe angulata]|uniref:Uncharacterized protein n=2 Tax=Ephemerocybe angulata TaxID=980116 RepID=A0A8H6IIH1_9AGAR|nr:hypothetical protein D9611_003179 [Tulosesus angulatus]KAF6766195.1 hypothetical protein DFP72DRAFT_9943 [Tulosesus angulatus]